MIILAILGIGLVAGWLAHLIVEGSRSNDWGFDLIAGFVGSLIGGLVINLLAGDGFSIRPSGLIGSVLGAVIFILAYRAITSRTAKPTPAHHESGDPRKRNR
jgi:uncharacterized membrane protein YeaQ/YmgE (transglycosylase-associated protein family)